MDRLKVLFLTYCYPPQKFPRSIQISHITKYLKKEFDIKVVTAQPESQGDQSLLSFTTLDGVIYAPKSKLTNYIENSRGNRLKQAILPDQQYFWHFDLFKKVKEVLICNPHSVFITFGQPMSTHIAGFKLKKIYPDLKWIAHFSDPWVDNIFNNYNFWTKKINQYYQDLVFKHADSLLFTSNETIDLVTKNYPGFIREKSSILQHSFNEELYIPSQKPVNDKVIIRYIGNFYGARQPNSFFAALQKLPNGIRQKIRVEFYGSATIQLQETITKFGLDDFVYLYAPVSYIDSLKKMRSSDMLLIIDAPTEKSPFLPSKLIDYIGANKPIFGITPLGTSQRLIEEMGFLSANPNNTYEIIQKFAQAIENVLTKKFNGITPALRDHFNISTVGKQLYEIIKTV